MPTGFRLRAATSFCAGAVAVHQVRFALAGNAAGAQPGSNLGHGYLALAAPLVAGALAVGLGHFLVVLARARRVAEPPTPGHGFRRLWAAATASLLCVYTAQELLEGLLCAGHPGGFAGVFGGGGWIAVLAALAVGALIALALRGADTALARAARRSRTSQPQRYRAHAGRPSTGLPFTRNLLANNLAGRAPPLLLGCL